jgi:hypothetical protein
MLNHVNLVQTQLSALQDKVIETTTIGDFASVAAAEDFLIKRGYKFDGNAWIKGNTVHYPVYIEEKEPNIFDIGSFV